MSARGLVIPAPARHAFGALQSVSRAAAARLAERWFFMPPRPAALSGGAHALLGAARRFAVSVDGRNVVGWTWGAAGPAVYLVHGWGSRGGRLSGFVEPLLDAGARVIAFDAPGHGASGRGLSSMPEFARALLAVAERHGPAQAIIGHSLGAAATTLAAGWGLAAARFALLAPAGDPAAFVTTFAAALGVRGDVLSRMRANSERRLRFSWTDLDICAVAARMTAPLLVVHDHEDTVVPFAEGASLAASWPGARLVPTSGLGHRGVVRDPGVIAQVVRFVTGGAIAAPRDESARLEHELFYRETRWM
jgi:pimeloyl-ACP methyl ester carboxylesterase